MDDTSTRIRNDLHGAILLLIASKATALALKARTLAGLAKVEIHVAYAVLLVDSFVTYQAPLLLTLSRLFLLPRAIGHFKTAVASFKAAMTCASIRVVGQSERCGRETPPGVVSSPFDTFVVLAVISAVPVLKDIER